MEELLRTAEQQRYLDNIRRKLEAIRQKGDNGEAVAKRLLETLEKDPKYIESQGRTLDQIFEDTENSFNNLEIFMSNALVIYKALEKNKTELTEKQKDTIKKIIRFGFDSNSVGYNFAVCFLDQNFELFSQEEKEELILKAIKMLNFSIHSYQGEYSVKEDLDKDLKGFPRVYSLIDRHNLGTSQGWSNGYNYDFSSRYAIKSMVENTLENSNNEKFIFDMLLYLAKEPGYFKIPENCKAIYSDSEKLKNYIISIKDLIENNHRYFREGLTHDIFKFFASLGIKITWDMAVLLGEEPYFYSTYYDKIESTKKISRNVIQEESVRTSLNTAMVSFKKENLENFCKYFSPEDIWKLLDDKYKMPSFVNAHIEELRGSILDTKGAEAALMQEFGRITEGKKLSDSEKFNTKVFKYGGEEIYKYIDLTTLNNFDFGNPILYTFVEKEGLLGTDYLDKVLKGHGYPKTHIVYYMLKAKGNVSKDFLEGVLDNHNRCNNILSSEEITAFIQDVYATQDENLVKKLFNRIGDIAKYCTQEEINILIRKMIKAISSLDDFKQFIKILDEHEYNDKFELFLKIGYLLTHNLNKYKLRDKKSGIPSDIYPDIVASEIIDISIDSLPEVGPSVYIDPQDLSKLSEYYGMLLEEKGKEEERSRKEAEDRQERLRKEKEEKDKIYNEALENYNKGEVIFDEFVRDPIFKGQKYILSVDREKRILKFISAPIEKYHYHSNLHSGYIKDGRCLGGGYIDKDDDKKVISLWGKSESYGYVSKKEGDAIKKMLETKFPNYKIRQS